MGHDVKLVEKRAANGLEICKMGIGELDKELNGGLPVGSAILLAGSSGSGKTTLCMQFLADGARQGERGIFFTVTEPLCDIPN